MASSSRLNSSEDFVEQILSRLPPKSLMRFQFVCNLWRNLIINPSFVAKHVSISMRASSKPVLIKRAVVRDKDNSIKDEKKVDNDDANIETMLSSLNLGNENDDDCLLSTVVEDLNVPLPAPLKLKHHSDLTIVGHCHGIICLKLFMGNIILCNPAMKEFKLLPKSSLLLPSDDFNLLLPNDDFNPNDDFEFWSFTYELRYYTENLGFGYDSISTDYKVVRFVIYDEAGYWFRAEVYTVSSNSWSEVKTKYNYVIHWSVPLHIYLDGICYWHVCGFRGEFILSFDMGDELFHQISFPDLPECTEAQLAVWKEFIALFTYQQVTAVAQSYDMWVMMDNLGDGKGSWTKHLTIGPVEGVKSDLLLLWGSDQLLMMTNDGHIVLYSIGTQILKYLPFHFMGEICDTQELVYQNSIVSIKGGSVLEEVCISAFYGNGKFYSTNRGETIDISAFYGNDKEL